jgi:hypothetical protein
MGQHVLKGGVRFFNKKLKKLSNISTFTSSFFRILLSIFLNDVSSCYNLEFLDCYDNNFPQNKIVFMGSPSITTPPNTNLDLDFLAGETYNGKKEINLINHYVHGPTGRNKLIVILMENNVKFTNWTL